MEKNIPETLVTVINKDIYSGAKLKLEKYINKFVQENEGFIGSVLVAKGEEILLCKGIGLANSEKEILNESKTVFQIGSVTKQFTSMAILILEERGLLSTEDTLHKYIPDYPNGDKIKLFNLLTMTSGIANYGEDIKEAMFSEYKYTPEQAISFFKNKPLNFEIGSKFEYSNSNYILLGFIIEKVSGITYGEFLKQNIFKPLNMKDTGLIYEETNKNMAVGYCSYVKEVNNKYDLCLVSNSTIAYAAGAMYSTVEDLYKWSRALLLDKLIKKETREKMYTKNIDIYAMGWMVYEEEGKRIVFHGGCIPGFVSDLRIDMINECTVITLSNRELFLDVESLNRHLLMIMEE